MATRQKYQRLTKTIIKDGEATQVTISSKEMKSTIAKAYGISLEAVDKKYYLYPIPTGELDLNPNLGKNFGW